MGRQYQGNRSDPAGRLHPILENLRRPPSHRSAKFLHDGGWGCYQALFPGGGHSNKIAAVDTKTGKLAAPVDVAKIPHLGAAPTSRTGSSVRSGQPVTFALTSDPDLDTLGREEERQSPGDTTGKSFRKSSTCQATCSSRRIRSPSTCGADSAREPGQDIAESVTCMGYG